MLECSNRHSDTQACCRRREDDGSKNRHRRLSSVAGKPASVPHVVRRIMNSVDIRKARESNDENAEDDCEECLNCGTRRYS
jgi:hypothetical protein